MDGGETESSKKGDNVLHWAAFHNDVKTLVLNLKSCNIDQKDIHGNTPLHIAVSLGHKECIALLLAHNASIKVKNAQGWTPLAEAISYGDRQIITSVLRKLKAQSKDSIQGSKPHLIDALRRLDDFYLELRWDFHSWLPLVSKILPSDVCKIYKCGTSLRNPISKDLISSIAMDTTLVDFNERSWERGDISFVFDSSAQAGNALVILDNKTKVYQKIRYEEAEGEIEDEVDMLMANDIVNAQMSTKSINFVRSQAGWFFRHDRSEPIGPFLADFYSLDGLVLISKKRREHLSPEDVAKNRAMLQSLQMGTLNYEPGKPIRRKTIAPPSKPSVTWSGYISADSGNPPTLGRQPVLKRSTKQFKATVAMSTEFPLTIGQNSLVSDDISQDNVSELQI